jgi:hypothetical protein
MKIFDIPVTKLQPVSDLLWPVKQVWVLKFYITVSVHSNLISIFIRSFEKPSLTVTWLPYVKFTFIRRIVYDTVIVKYWIEYGEYKYSKRSYF